MEKMKGRNWRHIGGKGYLFQKIGRKSLRKNSASLQWERILVTGKRKGDSEGIKFFKEREGKGGGSTLGGGR